MRTRILKEIEEEQKREKELKIRLRRNGKRTTAAYNELPPTTKISDSTAHITGPPVVNRHLHLDNNNYNSKNISNNNSNNISNNNSNNNNNSKGLSTRDKTLSKKHLEKQNTSVINTELGSFSEKVLHKGGARTLIEMEKCNFSSREDLVAFMGTQGGCIENENPKQEMHVQPLKIPMVFTSHTVNGSRNSPKIQRKEVAAGIKKSTSIKLNAPSNNNFISTDTSTPQVDINGTSRRQDNPSKNDPNARNKSYVFLEAEPQYLDHPCEEGLHIEKQEKKIDRSFKPPKIVKKEDMGDLAGSVSYSVIQGLLSLKTGYKEKV